MGVIVVVKVREKGGAVPGPWVHIRKALPKGSVHNRHPIVPENPSHMVRTVMAAGRIELLCGLTITALPVANAANRPG